MGGGLGPTVRKMREDKRKKIGDWRVGFTCHVDIFNII